MTAPPNIEVPGEQEELLRLELQHARAAAEAEAAARERLERALIAIVDAERRGLACLLHDTTCQSLNGIGLLSRVLLRKLAAASSADLSEVAELSQAIDSAVREIHSVVGRLRLACDDDQNLASALARVVKYSAWDVPCDLVCPAEATIENRFAAEQFIQIAHQAVSDAAHRPGVERLSVSLSTQDPLVTLTVRDDGAAGGARPEDAWLDGCELMRLRARAIHASLSSSFQPGQGTIFTCTLSRNI